MSPEHDVPEIQELNELIEAGIKNPNDPSWQGRMLLFQARRVKYMMERETVTRQELLDHVRNCPAMQLLRGDWKSVAMQQAPALFFIGYLIWKLNQ